MELTRRREGVKADGAERRFQSGEGEFPDEPRLTIGLGTLRRRRLMRRSLSIAVFGGLCSAALAQEPGDAGKQADAQEIQFYAKYPPLDGYEDLVEAASQHLKKKGSDGASGDEFDADLAADSLLRFIALKEFPAKPTPAFADQVKSFIEKAIVRFPDLKNPNSPLARRYTSEVALAKKENPKIFGVANWPMRLAYQSAYLENVEIAAKSAVSLEGITKSPATPASETSPSEGSNAGDSGNHFGTTLAPVPARRATGWELLPTVNAEDAPKALDGDPSTRWTTAQAARAGDEVVLKMERVRSITGVRLDSSESPKDFPHRFQLFLSKDGSHWGDPIATGDGTPDLKIQFKPQLAKYLRLVNLEDSNDYWSIHEIQIFAE